MIQNLITVEENFWKNHILTGKAPQPNGSEADDKFLLQRFPESSTQEVLPLNLFDAKLCRRAEIQEKIKDLEQEQGKIDQEIKLYMGEHAIAESEKFRVTWQSVSSERMDSKTLKKEDPETYQKYVKTISSRRFVVNPAA